MGHGGERRDLSFTSLDNSHGRAKHVGMTWRNMPRVSHADARNIISRQSREIDLRTHRRCDNCGLPSGLQM